VGKDKDTSTQCVSIHIQIQYSNTIPNERAERVKKLTSTKIRCNNIFIKIRKYFHIFLEKKEFIIKYIFGRLKVVGVQSEIEFFISMTMDKCFYGSKPLL